MFIFSDIVMHLPKAKVQSYVGFFDSRLVWSQYFPTVSVIYIGCGRSNTDVYSFWFIISFYGQNPFKVNNFEEKISVKPLLE